MMETSTLENETITLSRIVAHQSHTDAIPWRTGTCCKYAWS